MNRVWVWVAVFPLVWLAVRLAIGNPDEGRPVLPEGWEFRAREGRVWLARPSNADGTGSAGAIVLHGEWATQEEAATYAWCVVEVWKAPPSPERMKKQNACRWPEPKDDTDAR